MNVSLDQLLAKIGALTLEVELLRTQVTEQDAQISQLHAAATAVSERPDSNGKRHKATAKSDS